jgi:hypothetical protein
MSEIKVNKISPRTACGTTTLGDSGDTFTIPAGVTITNNGTQTGFGRTGTVDWQTSSIKTSTFTAANGEGYFCNTAGGGFEVDLPAGSAGAIVSIQDYNNTFDTGNLTIDPNGSEKINGGQGGVVLSTEGEGITLVYIDSTVGWRSIQDNDFASVGNDFISATGGTITTVCTNFKVHTFTGPGTFTVCNAGNPTGSNTISYMVIAGGGGSGVSGGGGGAGGFREGKTTTCSYTASPLVAPAGLPVSAQGYPITVGAGGAGNPAPSVPGRSGDSGSNSIFSTITSTGGGGGDGYGTPGNGKTGGSGGGGAAGSTGGAGNTPSVTPAQGKDGADGGANTGPGYSGGGGGGATVAGTAGNPPVGGGAGGAGATTSINGTPTARAGGGGGGSWDNKPGGAAGSGGGGAGNVAGNNPGTAGTANTGGGAGAPGSVDTSTTGPAGAAGGSGIVMIRYKFQ